MAWKRIGSITASIATIHPITVGPVFLPPFGGIEVWVRQTSGPSPWPYGFGLLWVENSWGRELGTIKVYGHMEGEAYRLGAGLSSLLGGGVLKFFPRSYNARWFRASGEKWQLEFFYDEPNTQLPADRYRAPGFQRPDEFLLPLVAVGNLGRLRF